MDMGKIRAAIDRDQDGIISDIREIVAVPSVRGEAVPGAPFGPGPKAAMEKFVEIGARLGFRAWAFEDQVGIAEFGDESLPEMIAILAHVDVVPTDEGWSCDPWQGKIEDGMVYGRGVADDKGEAISVLHALKALSDEGVRLGRRVRVIVGTNEESGCKAIARYVAAGQEIPVAGFTTDSQFPLIYAEKGIITVTCSAPFAAGSNAEFQIMSIDSGVAANAVPSRAVAVLKVAPRAQKRLDRAVEDFAAPRDTKLDCEKTGDDEYKLTMEGLSYHGARPQYGANAAANLVKFMRLLDVGGEQGAFLDKIDTLVGDQTRGENLGALLYDDVAGYTSLCWGTLKTEGEKITCMLNYRYPVTYSLKPVSEKFCKALTDAGFEITAYRGTEALYMPEDCDLVKKLMKVYQDETGDMESRPLCIGGGTYAKVMPNILAFGSTFPGEDTHIHEVDERWSIENIMKHTHIMAAAIAALAGVEE